jgi:hypothetical protein
MPHVSRFLRFAVALNLAVPAALVAVAASSGRISDSTSSEDASAGAHASLDGGTLDASADASEVDLLVDSGSSRLDSAPSEPPIDASYPPWSYGLDASPPDPFDAACEDLTLDLDPDATPGACEVSPADVACDAASDCTVLQIGHCCFSSVYGVNRASTAECAMPPCVPPPPGGGCGTTGFVTEDCNDVPSLTDVGLACIDHRCRTFAAGTQ